MARRQVGGLQGRDIIRLVAPVLRRDDRRRHAQQLAAVHGRGRGCGQRRDGQIILLLLQGDDGVCAIFGCASDTYPTHPTPLDRC